MKTFPNLVTPSDFPDRSHAFDGEESYPLTSRFHGPPLTAACWPAWYASTSEAPSANPKGIARLAARAPADIDETPARTIIAHVREWSVFVLTRGTTGWQSDFVAKVLYNNLRLCQVADSTEHGMAEAWLRALVLAHAVGAAEAQR